MLAQARTGICDMTSLTFKIIMERKIWLGALRLVSFARVENPERALKLLILSPREPSFFIRARIFNINAQAYNFGLQSSALGVVQVTNQICRLVV